MNSSYPYVKMAESLQISKVLSPQESEALSAAARALDGDLVDPQSEMTSQLRHQAVVGYVYSRLKNLATQAEARQRGRWAEIYDMVASAQTAAKNEKSKALLNLLASVRFSRELVETRALKDKQYLEMSSHLSVYNEWLDLISELRNVFTLRGRYIEQFSNNQRVQWRDA